MSSSPATPATDAAAPARRKMSFKYKLLLIVFSLLAMAFLRTGFVFIVIGMLPSIVIYYFDQSRHRFTFKTIFYCNMAGMLPYVAKLLRYGPTSMALQEVMQSPTTWLTIFGAAGMGGLLINITPQIAQMIIGGMHGTQVAHLRRAQKKLEQEWGKEVTQFGNPNEAQG